MILILVSVFGDLLFGISDLSVRFFSDFSSVFVVGLDFRLLVFGFVFFVMMVSI